MFASLYVKKGLNFVCVLYYIKICKNREKVKNFLKMSIIILYLLQAKSIIKVTKNKIKELEGIKM